MTDPELEDLLRQYRPAAPSPELRAHVVAALPAVHRTWPWAAAAAALLAATLGLQAARAQILSPPDPERAVPELQLPIDVLGSDEETMEEAKRLQWQQQLLDLVEESRREPGSQEQ